MKKSEERDLCAKRGVQIVRVTVGQAYPRNGNVHNPTVYYRYAAICTKTGKHVLENKRRSKLLQSLADDSLWK